MIKALVFLVLMSCRQSGNDGVREDSSMERPLEIEAPVSGPGVITVPLSYPDLNQQLSLSLWMVNRTTSSLTERFFLDSENRFHIPVERFEGGYEYSLHLVADEGRVLATWDWNEEAEGTQGRFAYMGALTDQLSLPLSVLDWNGRSYEVTSGFSVPINSVVHPLSTVAMNLQDLDAVEGVSVVFGSDLVVDEAMDILMLYQGIDDAQLVEKKYRRLYVKVSGEQFSGAQVLMRAPWWQQALFHERWEFASSLGEASQSVLPQSWQARAGSWSVQHWPKSGDVSLVKVAMLSGESFDYPMTFLESATSIPQVISVYRDHRHTPSYGVSLPDGLRQAFPIGLNEPWFLQMRRPLTGVGEQMSWQASGVLRVHLIPEFYEKSASGAFVAYQPSVDEFQEEWRQQQVTDTVEWWPQEGHYILKAATEVGGYDQFEVPSGICPVREHTVVKMKVVYETHQGLMGTAVWIE